MGIAAVKVKLMPSSAESDIEDIKNNVTSLLSEKDVENPQFEVEPIAFGLKSLTVLFGWPEENPLEEIEDKLGKVEGVGSSEVIDIRRAIG